MRIAIGGIMHESNTFSPALTERGDFMQGSLTEGEELIGSWKDAHHEVGGFIAGSSGLGYEVVPTAMAWATPSGPVSDEFFEDFTTRLAAMIASARPDGVLLALHGAMVTRRYADADAEVCRRVRAAIGPRVPFAVTLDFHGNPPPEMAEAVDILVAYQTYPHVDQRSRGWHAAELLARAIRGEIRPVCRIAKPPLIINLLGQATDRPPMSNLLASARSLEAQAGLLSISVMAGFPYADVPWMGPSIVAVADGTPALAQQAADQLAAEMWSAREQLYVPCPNAEEAVRMALASPHTPVVLVDLGDNIGGGSAGDGTVLLKELLHQQASGFAITLFAPDAVALAKKAGIGQVVELTVGGQRDRLHGDPVTIRGTVRSLHLGTWVETQARHGGRRLNDQGHTAVIDLGEGRLVILNSYRTPPFSLGQLTSLGIDPRQLRFIVVKAAVAYKAAYAPIAGTVIEVDTPGLTAINPSRFRYERIRPGLYPLSTSPVASSTELS